MSRLSGRCLPEKPELTLKIHSAPTEEVGRRRSVENAPRWRLVESIRREIEAGTYVTDTRLQVTAEKLVRLFGGTGGDQCEGLSTSRPHSPTGNRPRR
jgi:hypothetical protein